MFSNVYGDILTKVKHFGLNQNEGTSHWEQLPHCKMVVCLYSPDYSQRKVTKDILQIIAG